MSLEVTYDITADFTTFTLHRPEGKCESVRMSGLLCWEIRNLWDGEFRAKLEAELAKLVEAHRPARDKRASRKRMVKR